LTPERKEVVKAWVAAGLWIAIIAVESTDWLSAEHTGHILYPIFHYLFDMTMQTFIVVHHYLRKLGHFVGYFALSLLLFHAWKATLRVPGGKQWIRRWAVIAFTMSAFIASMDEWHQTFIPSRTGKFRDVVLDSFAAATAQVLIYFYWRWKTERKSAEKSLTASA
jgi:VanZ family protein